MDLAGLEAENAALRTELERLRESEKMYRFSAEIAGRLAWTTDRSGNVLAMSRIFSWVTGIADQQELKEHWADGVHRDDVDRVLAAWRRSLATGEPFTVEFRGLLPGGSSRTLLSRALPVRGADGAILRWYGSTEDVHEEREAERARREAEERLRESEELYRYTVELSDQFVWTALPSGRLLTITPRFAEVAGFAPGDDPTAAWERTLHPDEAEQVFLEWRAALEAGSPYRSEFRMRLADGSYRAFEVRAAPRRDAEGRIVRWYGTALDIEDRRRAEAEVRRMQNELVHVSRVSAMGAMASTLAHELNQPLTAVTNFVRGASRILSRRGEEDAVLLEALRSAEAGALRGGEIVRRLRELVSRGTASMTVEHLPRLIEEAGVLAFVDAPRLGVEHRFSFDPAAQWVRCDRVQIQQVLINLIRNAVEAMADGPVRKVTVTTRPGGADWVEVRVADTGPGIPADREESLFSRFMTTKAEGMGIGLPISRTIVEAHGGKIRAGNGKHGGAVFTFTLPRAKRRGAGGRTL